MSNELLAKRIFENNLPEIEAQLALGVRENGFSHYDFGEQTRLYDTMVTLAVKHSSEVVLTKLIELQFDVNESDDEHLTPLMLAVDRKKLDMFPLLLAAGANINAQDYSGYTSLMRAARSGDVDACKLLLAAGADTSITSLIKWSTDKMQNALQIAEEKKHANIVALLKAVKM